MDRNSVGATGQIVGRNTLAGRNVPWLVVLATTAATMIGGGASIGMVSRVYFFGLAFAVITCGWHLQLIFTGLFVAPRLRGLKLITVGDYFHVTFGPLARELAGINCVIFLVGALAAQMVAMGTVANTVRRRQDGCVAVHHSRYRIWCGRIHLVGPP